MNGQQAAASVALSIIQPAAQFVGQHLAQGALLPHLHADAGQLLVLIADNHVSGPGLVAGLGAAVGKKGHVHRTANEKRLPRAHVYAHLYNKIGIFLKKFLIHGIPRFPVVPNVFFGGGVLPGWEGFFAVVLLSAAPEASP